MAQALEAADLKSAHPETGGSGGRERPVSFFDPLGLYGLRPVEDSLLAALVTGDPVLLIGPHGTAKTLLARRLARGLALRFIAYDGSKALFEDVLGFPNPRDLAEGKQEVGYVRTPLSIWDKEFVLVDEVSRASPSMQSKWLELFRSRTIMGLPATSLRFIWGAMNPPGYLATIPLDAAFADRFAWVVPVPEFGSMDPEDARRVIESLSEDDAPALPASGRGEPDGVGVPEFVERARRRFPQAEERYGKRVTEYVALLASHLKLHKMAVHGRRAGMLRRNILARLAVRGERAGSLEFGAEELDDLLLETVTHSIPHRATAEEWKMDSVLSAHRLAVRVFQGGATGQQAKLQLLSCRDPVEAAGLYVRNSRLLAPEDHEDFMTLYEESFLSIAQEPGALARGFCGLAAITKALQSGELRTPPDVARRLLDDYLKKTVSPYNVVSLVETALVGDAKNRPVPVDLSRKSENLALRITIHVLCEDYYRHVRSGRSARAYRSFEEAAMEQLRERYVATRDALERELP